MRKPRNPFARSSARRARAAPSRLLRVARGIFVGAMRGFRRLRAANDPKL